MSEQSTLEARIIDAAGGTAKVATMLFLPYKTVHHWRGGKLPPTQLMHLQRALMAAGKGVPTELTQAIDALPAAPEAARAA